MKIVRSRRLLAIVTGLTLASTLAACGGGSDPADPAQPNENRPENEIHVLVLGDAAAAAEQEAADRFNQTSDVKVVIDTGSTAGSEYNTTIRSQIGTPNAPDIFMSWGAAGIEPLVQAGALLPLDDFIAEDPALKDSFVPSVFNEEVIDGKAYGIPMRGVAPEFLYYNKAVLDSAGLQPATTWDELISQVGTLNDAGVIPIGLAGADKWPQAIWLQYAYARQIGNEAVAKGLAGDTEVWASEGSRKALADVHQLVEANAFGSNYPSVTYGADGSGALLRTGKAAYELMGSWHYATVGDATNLGWTAFPSIDGGAGQPGEVAGNLSNYYNVSADTRYPDTVRDFLKELYSPEFQQAEIGLGNLPPTTDAISYVQSDTALDASTKDHLTFVSQLVTDAPTFQLSWNQVVPASQQSTLDNALADVFSGTISDDEFIKQMQDIVSAEQ